MANRYPSDSDRYNRVEPGISRGGRQGGAPRLGSAPRSGAPRSAAPRSGAPRSGVPRNSSRAGYSSARPSSRQAAYGQRPPQRAGGPSRRSGGRRRKSNRGALVIAGLAVVLLVALVLILANPFGNHRKDPVTDGPATAVSNPVEPADTSVQPSDAEGGQTAADDQGSASVEQMQEKLADTDNDAGSLSAEEMAQVSDLNINPNLPSEWLNVLLLGTDERTLSESARTDSMIICSINRKTGEVKLTSIMRDLAIKFDNIGKWNGTYRINAANYFGGPKLAISTINEKFGMNIQYYVMVNFFGFSKIAQRLGGVEVDITEQEMEIINRNIIKQFKMAYKENVDDFDPEQVYLETYGENTHLNGNQTLAYARIRKLTGGDAMRTERQRIVLEKLLQKAKKLDAMQLATLATEMFGQVKTNLPLEDMLQVAMTVCGNGLSDVESMYLPMAGTYKEEVRNEQAMLYDCDFNANAVKLQDFIYY